MLLPLDALPPFRSPCCGSPVAPTLACDGCGRRFSAVAGRPVLIDFTDSIIDEKALLHTAGASAVPRHRRRSLRRMVKGTNPVARANLRRLVDLLPDRAAILIIGGATAGEGTDVLYSSDCRVTALDVYVSDLVQVVADAHHVPFPSGTFDAVVIQAVLEHVLAPEQVVSEVHRVLRPGGLVYSEIPFLQPVHEGAFDFTRFTHSGHRWLFRAFSELDSGPIGGPLAALGWSFEYVVRAIFKSRILGRVVRAAGRPLLYLDRLVALRHRVDATPGTYFLGRRSDEPLQARQMRDYYAGAQRPADPVPSE